MSKLITSFFKKYNIDLRNVMFTWVYISSGTGAILSGSRKMEHIFNEPTPQYKNELFEVPMRGVYHTFRIGAHAGFGGFVAGFVAMTAPVSIPIYMYWRKDRN